MPFRALCRAMKGFLLWGIFAENLCRTAEGMLCRRTYEECF